VKGGLSVIEGFAGEEVPTGARGQVLFPVAEPYGRRAVGVLRSNRPSHDR